MPASLEDIDAQLLKSIIRGTAIGARDSIYREIAAMSPLTDEGQCFFCGIATPVGSHHLACLWYRASEAAKAHNGPDGYR